MVRFSWVVEEDFSAWTPANGFRHDSANKLDHCELEIELAGQTATLPALLTLPTHSLSEGNTSTVGVLIAHGSQADTWKGKLLTELAVKLAQQGHVVARYHCPGKEQRRMRVLEKVLDAVCTSPFAKGIARWVLAGIGNGARVCASIGSTCRAQIAGYLLMGYPLMEPMQMKDASAPDSSGPMTKLSSHVLFLQPTKDAECPVEKLREAVQLMPSFDVRLVEFPGLDRYFRDATAPASPTPEVRQRVATLAAAFVQALAEGNLETCDETLPRIKQVAGPVLSPAPPTTGQKPPLPLPPYHLLAQQHLQTSGATPNIQSLPPSAVTLLAISQEHYQKQQQVETALRQVNGGGVVGGQGLAMGVVTNPAAAATARFMPGATALGNQAMQVQAMQAQALQQQQQQQATAMQQAMQAQLQAQLQAQQQQQQAVAMQQVTQGQQQQLPQLAQQQQQQQGAVVVQGQVVGGQNLAVSNPNATVLVPTTTPGIAIAVPLAQYQSMQQQAQKQQQLQQQQALLQSQSSAGNTTVAATTVTAQQAFPQQQQQQQQQQQAPNDQQAGTTIPSGAAQSQSQSQGQLSVQAHVQHRTSQGAPSQQQQQQQQQGPTVAEQTHIQQAHMTTQQAATPAPATAAAPSETTRPASTLVTSAVSALPDATVQLATNAPQVHTADALNVQCMQQSGTTPPVVQHHEGMHTSQGTPPPAPAVAHAAAAAGGAGLPGQLAAGDLLRMPENVEDYFREEEDDQPSKKAKTQE